MASIRPQKASSSTPPCSHHVFLSFRGEDTRKNFTDHLYTALGEAGFRTFRDNEGIERGENIKSELQKAIQESKMSIVVLSKNYASSSSCLDELVMILRRRSTCGHVVLPVFYDVDPYEVKRQSECLNNEAFTRHEGKVEGKSGERQKEWMRKVEEWRVALKEVGHLAGLNLQNSFDGHESRLIQTIVKLVGEKLNRAVLEITPYAVGVQFRAREIQLWLEDESAEDVVIAISGMGGIGKTTIAKFLYNMNFSRFQRSCFLANVRCVSQQQDGLLRLQKQLLSDILKGREEKIYNVDEGIVQIKQALSFKRVFLVLDDIDKLEQINAVLGMRDWLFPGSKIIITTRHGHLLRAQKVCKVHRIRTLDFNESFELFSLYAFGQSHPIEDYADFSKLVVQHCGGLPLAIKVLASSLSGKSIKLWRSQLEKLKAIPDSEILDKLKISFDSLDDHDKNLFLHLACFFVGSERDCVITILDQCDFYPEIGIQNLIDRCLVTIECNKVVMHNLLQEMGREIVHQESPKEPGERSRLWNPEDSFKVLRQNTGTRKIEGLALDMSLLKEHKSARRASSREEFLDNSLWSNVGNSLRRYGSAIFSRTPVQLASADLNQIALEMDAFAKMQNLKFLQLGYVHINGSYKKLPKEIRWLCWHGFPCEFIPSDFSLETLVVLEMPYSSLKKFSDGTTFLKLLKILDLSHSHSLAKTPDFLRLPNLERLILEDCTSLVEVHNSVGHLERLVMLNLKDCSNLRKLPRSISLLKSLRMLDISGCSNLENLPAEMVNKDSLTVLQAEDVTGITRSSSVVKNIKVLYSLIWPSAMMPKKYLETSWAASFPRSLVKLSLGRCNLSDNAFTTDLSSLSSLHKLDLSDNPITSFPDFAKGLTQLELLDLSGCNRLRSVEVPLEVGRSIVMFYCKSLEKVTYQSPAYATRLSFANHLKEAAFLLPAFTLECDLFCADGFEIDWYGIFGCDSLVEISGVFKTEPLGNVDEEIINNLGLFPLGTLVNLKIMLQITSLCRRQFSLQGCHEKHVFYTFVPAIKVPCCFNLTNNGSSIDFTVPHHNGRIQGLSLFVVYACSSNFRPNLLVRNWNIIIGNATKRLVWSHLPLALGIPKADEDMLWLSYWKFENQLEGGDELNISVYTLEGIQVKELGVHLVYDAEKTENMTQQALSSSEEVSREITSYGNAVPGRQASYDQETTQVFNIDPPDFYVIEALECGRLPLSHMLQYMTDGEFDNDNGEFDDD